jgi:D-alanyl-D-alanine carboxypeptidase
MSYRRPTAAWCAVVITLTLITPCFSQSPAPVGSLFTSANAARKIDPLVAAGRSELKLPGVSIAMMRAQKLIFAKGYGWADRERGVAPSERTVYPIGSLSKQFTAAAVMKLVEQGRVRLDEPVDTYLPEYNTTQDPPLLVRHLLYQTSGVPEWDGLREMEDIDTGDPARFTLNKVVELLRRQSQLYLPGAWWSYSNSNYSLLAAVIERVAGMTYEQYLSDNFFIPLGLGSTGSCQPERDRPAGDKAVGYVAEDGSFVPRLLTANKARAFTGSGGMCSSALDLITWMRALVDGKAVSNASFRQMTRPAPVRAGFTPPYGFGLSVVPLAGQPAVWHIGVLAGYTSVLAYFPKQDLIIAALANARRAPLQTLVRKVARAVMNLPTPVLRDISVSAKEVERAVGNYDDGMFKFRIFAEDGKLYIHVSEFGPAQRLRYQGKGEFVTAEPGMIRLWFEPATGLAERVTWEWGEIRAYGRRVP